MGDRGPLQVENDKKQNYFHKLNKNCIHSFWHFHKICGAIISCCLSTLQVKYLFAEGGTYSIGGLVPLEA